MNNAQETNRVNAYINITLILHQDAGRAGLLVAVAGLLALPR